MPTTLKDIASVLNLSVNTVSRGLRNMADISPATRELVHETAKRLGYQKNMAASCLRTNRSYILGVIVTDYDNPSNYQIINGAEKAGKSHGFTIMVGATDNNVNTEESMVRRMLEQSVDGILLVPTMFNPDVLTLMEDNGIPYVLVARKYEDHESNYVYSDDSQGCGMVAESLYQRGHRNFLYMKASLADNISQLRYDSFVEKLCECGLPKEQVQSLSCDGTRMDARRVLGMWLDALPPGEKLPVSVIFAFADYTAVGCYMALEERGYRIPQDISLVGYDNTEFSKMMNPSLCTVDNHFFALGASAAERIVEMLEYPETRATVQKTVVVPEIVWRDSVANLNQ